MSRSSAVERPVIAITSGEPAGIGPELIAHIDPTAYPARLVVLGDRALIDERAQQIGRPIEFKPYQHSGTASGTALEIIDIPLRTEASCGKLDPANAAYVLEILERACTGCLAHEFDAMVTAPIQKDVINEAGIPFSGHTEFLADLCGIEKPVMLLATDSLRVALATTHLALRDVADAINTSELERVLRTLDRDLSTRFGIERPHIKVCGLNPHAGENGYLGREEIEIIIPLLERLIGDGINLSGPYPADTVFTQESLADADAVLAMYHDQGLPVLKHAGFNQAINTTLGLPIVRTSVDHGTALALAGSGEARPDSLFAAIGSAIRQSRNLAHIQSTDH